MRKLTVGTSFCFWLTRNFTFKGWKFYKPYRAQMLAILLLNYLFAKFQSSNSETSTLLFKDLGWRKKWRMKTRRLKRHWGSCTTILLRRVVGILTYLSKTIFQKKFIFWWERKWGYWAKESSKSVLFVEAEWPWR